ncbi:MAG: phospholipid/cholesterol/gamma-HCH transport system substrate-binding protein [Glaciecola sp.]
MKISREVKTAILVIVSTILIVFLFNYLKGQNLLDSSRKVFVVYDNVEGLASSSPVTLNGHTIGRVQEIGFTTDGTAKIKVLLSIEDDIQFSKNSIAELYDTGLIGGKGIAIIPAFDDDENAVSGDVLVGTSKSGIMAMVEETLAPLQDKIGVLLVSADSLFTNINDVFDEPTKNSLKRGISELEGTISSFKNTSITLNQLIVNNKEKLDNTLTNFEDASANISNITDSIASTNLTKTINDLQVTIGNFNNLLSGIENGEGSIGKLLKDEGLYNNLEGATKQMEELLQDMKLNPKRYVHFSLFGKKAKVYDEEGNEIKEKKN